MPLDGDMDVIKGPFEAMTFKIGNPSRDLTLGYSRSIDFLGKLLSSERKRDERMRKPSEGAHSSSEHDDAEEDKASESAAPAEMGGKKPCDNRHNLPEKLMEEKGKGKGKAKE